MHFASFVLATTMRLPLLRLTTLRRSLATSRTLPELKLRVSTLKNGIRVATDPTPGHFVAAGVYVDAGSRYESEATRGASHLMDRIGFKVLSLLADISHHSLLTLCSAVYGQQDGRTDEF